MAECAKVVYRPRRPRETPFYRLVEDYFERFEQIYPERYEDRYGYLRPVIRDTVYKYLNCGLTLVSVAKIALGTDVSVRAMMQSLSGIHATLLRTTTGGRGRRPTVMIAPDLTAKQMHAVKVFDLGRWFPALLSCIASRPKAA